MMRQIIRFFGKFRYRVVRVERIVYEWGCGSTASMVILFLENGRGKRKLETEGSLYPAKREDHSYWSEVALPWKYRLTDTKKKSGDVVPLKLVK